jgi:DNA-binding NtrC family response regulator
MAMKYLYYDENAKLPVLYQQPTVQNQQSVELSLASSAITDRELLLKALSMGQMIKEMKEEINELKKTLLILTSRQQVKPLDDSAEDADNANLSSSDDNTVIDKLLPYEGWHYAPSAKKDSVKRLGKHTFDAEYINDDAAEELLEVTSIDAEVTSYEEPLSLEEREIVAIKKALEKNGGNRRKAAKDLRIAERTLYRKLKSYGLD